MVSINDSIKAINLSIINSPDQCGQHLQSKKRKSDDKGIEQVAKKSKHVKMMIVNLVDLKDSYGMVRITVVLMILWWLFCCLFGLQRAQNPVTTARWCERICAQHSFGISSFGFCFCLTFIYFSIHFLATSWAALNSIFIWWSVNKLRKLIYNSKKFNLFGLQELPKSFDTATLPKTGAIEHLHYVGHITAYRN